jgi:hypothetical protein
MVPRLLTALTRNGLGTPSDPRSAPPTAGPTARLTFTLTLFAATAAGRSGFGTRRVTTASHAGAVSASPAATRKAKASRFQAVTRWNQTTAANRQLAIVMQISPKIRNLRLSTMSTSAPAGMANRNTGSIAATCTSETISGAAARLVISHPQAAEYIQLPMFAASVAVQMTLKGR